MGSRIEKRGAAYALSGPGASILTVDLAMLDARDLAPTFGRWIGRQHKK